MEREDIIRAAITAWSRSGFVSTSLNDVASELGVTKQALYRYYPGKDALIEAIRDEVERLHVAHCSRLSDLMAGVDDFMSSLEVFVAAKADSLFAHPAEYLFFFVPPNIKIYSERFSEFYAGFEMRERELFLALFGKSGAPSLSVSQLDTAYVLVQTASALGLLKPLMESYRKGAVIDDEEFKRIKHGVFYTLCHGVCREDAAPDAVDAAFVEDVARVGREELPQLHRIFEVVEGFINRKGMSGTSLGEVARELGMSKSSLYSHFKDKDSMINTVMENQISGFMEPLIARFAMCRNTWEKVLCYILYSAAYVGLHSRILGIMAWLRLNLPMPQKDDVAEPGFFASYRDMWRVFDDLPLREDVRQHKPILYLHALVFSYLERNPDKDFSMDKAMDIYAFFLKGLFGMASKKYFFIDNHDDGGDDA